jgi:hypothetical protein
MLAEIPSASQGVEPARRDRNVEHVISGRQSAFGK